MKAITFSLYYKMGKKSKDNKIPNSMEIMDLIEDNMERLNAKSLLEIKIQMEMNDDDLDIDIDMDMDDDLIQLYERLLFLDRRNPLSVYMFIKSTIEQIDEKQRKRILLFINRLPRFISEDVVYDSLLSKDDIVLECSEEEKVYNELFKNLITNTKVGMKIKEVYDTMLEYELGDIELVEKLKNMIKCRGDFKLSYFLPYIYYCYMKHSFNRIMKDKNLVTRIDRKEKRDKLKELEEELIILFSLSDSNHGMLEVLNYLLG